MSHMSECECVEDAVRPREALHKDGEAQTDPPKVFISYSHDSLEHEDTVLAFSNRLRDHGINSMIDQYDEAPAEGWPRWMDGQLRAAQFILLICTETYNRRVQMREEPGKGHGVLWESNLIYNYLYASGTVEPRFIPVLFRPEDAGHIPMPLQGVTHYDIHTEDGYWKLYRRITKQPSTLKPPIGHWRALPPRKRHSTATADPVPAMPDREEPFDLMSMTPQEVAHSHPTTSQELRRSSLRREIESNQDRLRALRTTLRGTTQPELLQTVHLDLDWVSDARLECRLSRNTQFSAEEHSQVEELYELAHEIQADIGLVQQQQRILDQAIVTANSNREYMGLARQLLTVGDRGRFEGLVRGMLIPRIEARINRALEIGNPLA